MALRAAMSWNWSGTKKAKFLQMCERDPEGVAAMSMREMDDYLRSLERTRIQRMNELYLPCLKKCGVKGGPDTWSRDPMFFKMRETAHYMAEEIATQEMMDA